MEIFLAAISLGLLGSMHCIGMCGPIALALPAVNNTSFSRIAGILLYNAGRVLTYGLLGLTFGLLGKTFIVAGYQQALSIIAGSLILLIVVTPQSYAQRFGFTRFLIKPVVKLKSALGGLFTKKTYSSLFSVGLLNGLLPCGLVYTAVAGAIAVANPVKSSVFMAVFGLGTVPAMLVLAIAGQRITAGFRNKFKRVSLAFVTGMGLLLIIRGLNLGIPYVSPQLDKTNCTIHHCCNK